MKMECFPHLLINDSNALKASEYSPMTIPSKASSGLIAPSSDKSGLFLFKAPLKPNKYNNQKFASISESIIFFTCTMQLHIYPLVTANSSNYSVSSMSDLPWLQ